MNGEYTIEDARRQNEALRRISRMDRLEIDELTDDLRAEANRNHFAERLNAAFASRRHA